MGAKTMRKLLVWTVVIALLATAGAYAAAKGKGTLKFKEAGTVLELTFANKQKLNVTSKGVSVPEGTYTPEVYALLKPTRDGTVWRIEGIKGNLGELATIEVVKGETKEYDRGAPLKMGPMRYRGMQDKTGAMIIPIGYTIKGKNGENYSLEIMMGARHAPLPYFQILDGNDKVLKEGQFEYG